MAYGKFKMVTNPKGVEEARRQQEKEKRNPGKGTKKEAPIVKFGSERRAKPMPISIDELRNRGNSPRKPNPEKRPPRRPLNPGGTAEKRPFPKPGKTLIDTIKQEKRPINKPGIKGSKRSRSNDVIRNRNIPPSVLGRVSIMGTPKPRKRGGK